MKPGEKFEIECFEYLSKKYGQNLFARSGGMDSTVSDIAVIKNGKTDFYIEAKMTSAQSGQFVLLPDNEKKKFAFSPKNKSTENAMTDIIIKYMNNDFDRFDNAGTAGQKLDIDVDIFNNWIINHYKEQNAKFMMSYNNGYVILPIRKFSEYFDVKASYRIKKSGSTAPAAKYISDIKSAITETYPNVTFIPDGKKLFAKLHTNLNQSVFELEKYDYFLSERSNDYYEIRQLSNTYNMNVIFSIKAKKEQADADLKEFESMLK